MISQVLPYFFLSKFLMFGDRLTELAGYVLSSSTGSYVFFKKISTQSQKYDSRSEPSHSALTLILVLKHHVLASYLPSLVLNLAGLLP